MFLRIEELHHNDMNKLYRASIFLSFLLISMFSGFFAFAEGSRDLYPSGAPDVRAMLRSSTSSSSNWPFPSTGTHYVYAKAGERITLASSARGAGSARIQLYAPGGNATPIINEPSNGRIADRTSEKAGPLRFGESANGSKYTPLYYQVPTGSTQEPTYLSLNTTSNLGAQVHNPNLADTERHITHKMFYTQPATDLPPSSIGAVPGGATWLKNEVVAPDVMNVSLVGVDGTVGRVSNKAGYVRFDAGAQGQYTIEIKSTASPETFPMRTLTGQFNLRSLWAS